MISQIAALSSPRISHIPLLLLGGTLALTMLGGDAAASGYSLRETMSGTAFGNGLAGATAGADDISYMSFNPAGLTRHSGVQGAASATILIPRVKFRDGSASTFLGTTIEGNPGGENITPDMVVPAIYGMWGVNDDLRLGLAINAPWGLRTDNPDGWIGRYHALHTRLETLNINPVVAYRLTDWLSVGAGLQIQRIDAKVSNAVDFGTIGAAFGVPGSVPSAQDGNAKVTGDDWGAGYNFGVLIEPWHGTRFGVAYRSKISQDIQGDATFTLDSAGIGAALQGATGMFVNTGASASVTTPDSVSFGAYHELTPQWAVMFDAAWTRWSSFKELRVSFDNPAQADYVTEANWKNTWSFAVGTTYRPDEDWTIRTGILLDESPVPDSTRTPRIPDADRIALSLGVSYQPFPWLIGSLSYSHMFFGNAPIDLTTNQPDSLFRGNLSGKYDLNADIVTVQINIRL